MLFRSEVGMMQVADSGELATESLQGQGFQTHESGADLDGDHVSGLKMASLVDGAAAAPSDRVQNPIGTQRPRGVVVSVR